MSGPFRSRLLDDPAFEEAGRFGDSATAGLYVPVHDESFVPSPSTPHAIAEMFSVAEDLRARAAETGIDPFSSLAHRVVSPLLVHTVHHRDEGYAREVTVFDNGALELRRAPAGPGAVVRPWAASRRLGVGTMVELRRRVADFDDDAQTAPAEGTMLAAHELITPRTRRRLSVLHSASARALIEEVERIVGAVEPPAFIELLPSAW